MALISCPECKKEISDRVAACPHCGYPFENERRVQKVELSSVNIKSKNPKVTKKLMISIIYLIVVIILSVGGLLFYKNEKVKYEKKLYVDNLNLVIFSMLDGAAQAEELCNLTYSVWRNTIYEENDSKTNKYTIVSYKYSPDKTWYSDDDFENDFNIALAKLFTDSETINAIKDIEENQSLVMQSMKNMQNPPDKLEKCYETVNDLYSTYQGLTELAISPKGSLQTFGENKTEKANMFLELYKKIEIQIPELEDYKLKFIFDN